MHYLLMSVIALLALNGCASSSYFITSNPSGANVYYVDPASQKKFLMGTTPVQYSKSSIPNDAPFMMSFEKEGYVVDQVPVANSDDSKTVINVKLKPEAMGNKEDKELQRIVAQLFSAQNLIFRKQYQAAIIELDKVLAERPSLAHAYVMKGTAYYLLKEIPSATDSWKKAMRIDPENQALKDFLIQKNIELK